MSWVDRSLPSRSRLAPQAQVLGQIVLPSRSCGVFGREDVVGAARDGRHEGQVAAVASHDLDDECPLVRGSGAGELVDRVQDAVQGGVRADRHVGADHVVVDRADQADDDEGRMSVRELLRDDALGDQLSHVLGPFLTELVRARQGAIAADNNQVIDAVLQQVRGRAMTALVGAEFGGTSGADDGATLGENRRDVRPVHLLDGIAPVARPLPAFQDRIGLRALRQRRAHHCADGRVHALGVAARGQDTDTDCAHDSAIFH